MCADFRDSQSCSTDLLFAEAMKSSRQKFINDLLSPSFIVSLFVEEPLCQLGVVEVAVEFERYHVMVAFSEWTLVEHVGHLHFFI